MKQVLVALLVLGAVSCGGSGESFSCNYPDQKVCLTISFPAGVTLSNKSCTGGTASATLVDSCDSSGIVGRCTNSTSVTVSGSSVTQTTIARYYTGVDLAAAQTSCMALSGVWTTP